MNLKKIIYHNHLLRGWKYFSPYLRPPLFLICHLTLRCNGLCADCYQRADAFFSRYQDDMAKSDFEILAAQANSLWMRPRLHLFGGEPLLHPEFKSILHLASHNHLPLSLTTNGVMLGRYLSDILSSGLDQINLSLHSSGDRHDAFVGIPGAFAQVMRSISALRKEEKKRSLSPLIVNINCHINETNYDNLLNLPEYLEENKIKINALSFQHKYWQADDACKSLDMDVLKVQIAQLRKRKWSFPVYSIPRAADRNLAEYYSGQKRGLSRCNLPWVGLNVMPNLDILPGSGVLGCRRVIGNLHDSALSEIWRGEKLKAFQGMVNNTINPECHYCCYRN